MNVCSSQIVPHIFSHSCFKVEGFRGPSSSSSSSSSPVSTMSPLRRAAVRDMMDEGVHQLLDQNKDFLSIKSTVFSKGEIFEQLSDVSSVQTLQTLRKTALGFSAEISVFVQTGDSVQLDIQTHELPEFDDLSWRNEKSENIVKYMHASKTVKPHPSYKDRVDFNDKTFSLTLKNMQKTDSGLYTARANGVSEKIIVTYTVSVIDAVEAPVLTVNSNWSSSDSCTVNFTCRAHDLTINSSYQNNRCSPEEVTSHENYTLILYCSEESIICNHRNPVSSKKVRIEIKPLCVNNKDNNPHNNQTNKNQTLPIWPFILLGVCLLPAAAIFLYCKRKKGVQEADNTVYAQVEAQEIQKTNTDANTYDVPGRVQDHTHEETRDYRPNTMYCTVGQHQKPADHPETDRTIYAMVCKQPKPTTISSDDTQN